jgi:hypothetical protein
MVNPFRGEVALQVNGETLPMRLSLGALANLEDRLSAEGLLPLIERFESSAFKANDIIVLLHSGLMGAGWTGTETELRSATIEGGPMEAARAAGTLLRVTFSLPEASDAPV